MFEVLDKVTNAINGNEFAVLTIFLVGYCYYHHDKSQIKFSEEMNRKLEKIRHELHKLDGKIEGIENDLTELRSRKK